MAASAPALTGLSPKEALAAALLTVKNRSPWMFGTLLFLKRTWAPGTKTVGTTENGRLLADPEFINKVAAEADGIEKIATVLEHEFMHLVLKHGDRGRAMGLSTSEELARWNKAGDLGINPLLRDQNRKFPECVPPLMPEQYGFEVGLTAEGYYSLLKEYDKEHGEPPPGVGPCSGNCCSNNHGTGESDTPGQDDGQGPPLPTGPQMDQKMAEAASGMREAVAKNRGLGSAGILRTLDEILAPPRVRWDEKLRRLVSFFGEHKPGTHHPTFNRMSKKQGGLGYGPGSARMPTTYSNPVLVGVVLDTSGSMGAYEMGSILPEAEQIIKHARGEVVFLACDASVNAMVKIKNTAGLIANAKGGGGTNMLPAIHALQAMEPKYRPKLVVFFTDAFVGDIGPEPEEFKVIWCSTTKHTESLKWGEVVILCDDDEPVA